MSGQAQGASTAGLVLAMLLAGSSGSVAVSTYNEGFNWYQAEGDLSYGKVEHCDSFLLDTESTAYCADDEDGDGVSERDGFFASPTGPLQVDVTCKWDIHEPEIGSQDVAGIVIHVEEHGSQVVCEEAFNRSTAVHTTVESAWEKSGILGTETNATITDRLNVTSGSGEPTTLASISWALSWVVGGIENEAASLQDPSGDDHYSLTSPDAIRWGIKDPSGDDYLEDDEGNEIAVAWGDASAVEGIIVQHRDLAGDAEEWIFESEDGSPIATDLHASGDGREAVTYTYS